MKFSIKFLLVALLYWPCTTFAEQSKSSIEIPTTIQKSFEQPSLVGSATLKFLGMKVYDIFLWSEGVGFSYKKKFAIHIKYNMNFSREDLAQRSIVEIEKLHELSKEEKETYLKNLKEIFHPIKKGDEKTAIFVPSKGVTMFHNSEITGKIYDQKLSRLFVDIWLDERGSYPEVTRKLLGKEIF
jgi:hypothetical protein